jgi:hypothetical protein
VGPYSIQLKMDDTYVLMTTDLQLFHFEKPDIEIQVEGKRFIFS